MAALQLDRKVEAVRLDLKTRMDALMSANAWLHDLSAPSHSRHGPPDGALAQLYRNEAQHRFVPCGPYSTP
jgi:hypothetical protein